MGRKLLLLFSSLTFVVLLSILYYTFIYKETFESSAEGLFLPEQYEEKYRVFETTIEVNKTKYEKLHIDHRIQLKGGSLIYELYDPKGNVVDRGEVTIAQPLSKQLNVAPQKGLWKAKYYTNKDTNGKYILVFQGGRR
ncbi:hypothetical protein [Anoxybacillus flavithermus]|uniref:Uncharacterized protein n=1 Tax=Anoxybacillus flavithermus AK1 TaxID=1297581 RepID=M8D5M8_9BACL|nr:hypothetical protein [Anoxybacillus flavithermus]EMT46102.1 hypothetical protein H919_07321 [Anoxybacillus flavithermus AK1]